MLKIFRFLSNKYIFCFPMMQMFACPYLFMFFSFIYQIILPYRQRIKNGGNIPKKCWQHSYFEINYSPLPFAN